MKKFNLSLVLAAALAATTGTAAAQEVTADLGVESAFIYRGQDLSANEDYSLNGSFRVQDAFVDGFYFRAQANSIRQDNGKGTFRVDGGAGFARDLGTLNYDVSVNRVVNPVIYADDFTEARLQGGVDLTPNVNLYGLVAQQVGGSTTQDGYVAVGVDYINAFGVPSLKLGAQTSAQRYNNYNDGRFSDLTRYNNTEVQASYLIRDRVAVYGKHSWGGRDRFDDTLDDVSTVGVRVLF